MSSSVVIRQTPQPIELVSMCPGMDLVAVSFTASSTTASSDSSNKNNNKAFSVYVFRTRPEQQLSGDDADANADVEQNGEKEQQQQNNNNMTMGEDHDGTVKNNNNNNKSNSNSDHLSMLNTPPIYAYSIKGGSTKNSNNDNNNRITSLQWAPAGGRILCISTLDQIHIVHVELQSLLRVHDLSLPQQTTTTTTQDHERNPHCLLHTTSDDSTPTTTSILATTWTRLPLHDTALGSPFPVSKILACENCGIPSSNNSNNTAADSTTSSSSSSTSFSPQLLELAESEWSNGQASVLFVALSNGSLCVLLGGLMLFSVLNGKTTSTTPLFDAEKSSNSTLFVGPFHSNQNQFATILSSSSSVHQLISSSSSSSPLSQIINNSISIHSRLICQSREILLKLKSDLRDAQAYWAKTVSKVLEKGLPQIMWNYRHEILASMINGQVVRRLMERKELEQSGVVAAAEMLRDTSCTLMKSVVDVAFECIGVLSDHAGVLVKNNNNKNNVHQHQIDDLVAALRDEVSTWVRQVSTERELLSSVLRWLHHYIGSIRSAVIFEEELAMRQDPNNNNQPPPTPPPSVSHVEANDHLIAFDFLSAIVDEEDENDSSPSTTSPAMPSIIRLNLLRVASSVQHHAQVLLDQLSSSSSSSTSSDGGTDNINNFSWSNKLQITSLQSLPHLAVSCTSFGGAGSSSHQYPHALSYDIQQEMGMMMMSVSSDGGNTSNNKNVMPRCVNISELSTTGSSSDADYFACDYQPQEDCLELFN